MLGSYAVLAQIIFFANIIGGSCALSYGLPNEQKSVLNLGDCMRNLGAAFALPFSVADTDERVVVMVALGVPLRR